MRQPEVLSRHVQSEDAAREKRSAQKFWTRYFYFYDTLNESAPYRQMVSGHAHALKPAPGDLILDAGTGTGNVAVILLAGGAGVIGIDFCEQALERCRKKDARGDFRFGDITRPLDFPSDYFDKVSCCNVFQFLSPYHHPFAFAELFRVLKPGGLFAVTVFAAGFSSGRVYRETLLQKRRESSLPKTIAFTIRYSLSTLRILYYVWRIKKRQAKGQYYFFDNDGLRRMLEATGFQILEMQRVFASQCVTVLATKPESLGSSQADVL